MERCKQRLEQGLPPCPEIEEEWRRILRDKKRRQRDKEEKERVKKQTRKPVSDINGSAERKRKEAGLTKKRSIAGT